MAEKATQGQKAAVSPLRSAGTINRVLAAADFFVDTQSLGKGGAAAAGLLLSDIVTVKNLTGSDIRRGACMELGDLMLTELDAYKFWFEANYPGGAVNARIVITRKPIKDQEIGQAFASGVCIVRVNVTDITHTFAVAVNGTVVMDSATGGPVQLLSPPDGTGIQEMIGRFCPSDLDACNPAFDITPVEPEAGDKVLGIRDGCLVNFNVSPCT